MIGQAHSQVLSAAEVAGQEFDLIVIGAGINGTGIARDAASRGLHVLLVDKSDIGGGTTSWSTRLIHGGLRYLEHGELGLVRESLRERERLLRVAPHLVRPLPLLIPMYAGDRRGPWLIRAGMIAYDLLSYDKSLPRHEVLSREQALAQIPGLNPNGLRGAARYYDAQVEFPERLAVENALAARALGAVLLTYTKVERLLIENGEVRGVELLASRPTGTDGRSEIVCAPAIVNVAGPWVDQVLVGGGDKRHGRLMGGTKGSHLVTGAFPGAPCQALYTAAKQDGRPFFIIPWNKQYLIGTTDVRFSGDLDHPAVTDTEIDYLLAETNRVFPSAGLDRTGIHYTYAGVRPLPFAPDGAEGAITRRHILREHAGDGASGLLSIIGGKLTTYRELSAQVVDWAQRRLDLAETPSRTGREALPGAGGLGGDLASFRQRFINESGLPARSAAHLVDIYGGRATDVLALANTEELRQPFDEWTGAIGAEVVFAFTSESATTLTDVLMRRTMVGLGPDLGRGAAEAAAAIAAGHCGWDDDRVRSELADYRSFTARLEPESID